jgi:hypothetical protein
VTALVAAPRMWLGPFVLEGQKAYLRALESGVNVLGAKIEGDIASFRDCWAPRRTIARRHRCSVRTVQRKLTAAQNAGRIRKFRSKPGEIPPGAKKPFWCGFAHKITIGWGKAGDEVKREIELARNRQLERRLQAQLYRSAQPSRRSLQAASSSPRPRWTAFTLPAPAPAPSSAPKAKPPAGPRTTSSQRPERVTAEWIEAEMEKRARDGPE